MTVFRKIIESKPCPRRISPAREHEGKQEIGRNRSRIGGASARAGISPESCVVQATFMECKNIL
jgi:hypothetical protein